jgi:hypothetical protein
VARRRVETSDLNAGVGSKGVIVMQGLEVFVWIVVVGLLVFVACCVFAALELHVERWWRGRQLRRLEKLNGR